MIIRKFQGFCFKMMQEGTFNWFKYRELYLQLSLHTNEYNKGSVVLMETIQNPKFEFLPENVKEIWRIYEAFIHWLAAVGLVNLPAGASKFKLAKFINETSIFSKDKSGINIAIIVVKLLLMLQEKRYSQILDEVEAVEQYCYRHLRGENEQRSNTFLKMLMTIPMSGFDPEVAAQRSERYLQKLRKIPLQLANQTHEIEVIPYETLWEIVITALKSKTKQLAVA